jgi:hypothetical protein
MALTILIHLTKILNPHILTDTRVWINLICWLGLEAYDELNQKRKVTAQAGIEDGKALRHPQSRALQILDKLSACV